MTKHDYSKEIAAIYQTVYNRKPGETFLAPSSTSPDWWDMDQFPPPVEEVRESIEVTRETLDGQISYLIKRASDMYVEEENLSEEDLEDFRKAREQVTEVIRQALAADQAERN